MLVLPWLRRIGSVGEGTHEQRPRTREPMTCLLSHSEGLTRVVERRITSTERKIDCREHHSGVANENDEVSAYGNGLLSVDDGFVVVT